MVDPRSILTRHPGNPLIRPEQHLGLVACFNPSPFLIDGRIGLLVSTTRIDQAHNFRETYLATSEDGIGFEMSSEPLLDRSIVADPRVRAMGGMIDSRVTKIDDWYYIISPQGTWEVGHAGCCGVMYRTKDFKRLEFVEVLTLPWQRGCSLFPEKIKGKYWKLDRPGEGDLRSGIWISSSPDLIHWGCYRPLLAPGYSIWNGLKIGPTPPLRVPEGWLVIIHGMDKPDGSLHYYIGAMLLDAEDPGKILGKTRSYLLAPDAPYEALGQVNNVVFPTGALAFPEEDKIFIYYGAADTRVCLATGSLREVIDACIRNA
jgi:predicted GH43/DUF377 family glycosyl hydrolase